MFIAKGKPTGHAPARLNFSKGRLGTDFTKLSPAFDQAFFIGNGKTSSSTLHRYKVLAHATRLFLGIADGCSFEEAPGYYNDNGGAYIVNVHFAR